VYVITVRSACIIRELARPQKALLHVEICVGAALCSVDRRRDSHEISPRRIGALEFEIVDRGALVPVVALPFDHSAIDLSASRLGLDADADDSRFPIVAVRGPKALTAPRTFEEDASGQPSFRTPMDQDILGNYRLFPKRCFEHYYEHLISYAANRSICTDHAHTRWCSHFLA
jgi:hypothetical protein